MIRTIARRMAIVAVAAIAVIALSHTASAYCCNSVTIVNNTGCSFQVSATINHVAHVNWTINPGNNVFPFSQCFDVDVQATDTCGHVYTFPTTADPCIDILFSTWCCLKICPTGPCQWSVGAGSCEPCPE